MNMENYSICGEATSELATTAEFLFKLPPGRRGPLARCALSFVPEQTVANSFSIGPLRIALANCWETRFREPVPVHALRELLEPPIHISYVLQFGKLRLVPNQTSAMAAVVELLQFLRAIETGSIPISCRNIS